MLRRGTWMVLGVITLLLGIGALVFVALHFTNAPAAKDSAVARGNVVRVRVIHPRQGGPERTVTRPGTLHSFQRADLYAKVTGYLKHQVVDIGDVVKQDQALADIYAPEINANVQKAVADLNKAKAQVDVMKARQAAAAADVQEAQANVAQKQADLQNAEATVVLRNLEYKRMQTLAREKAVEQELADEKRQAQQAAESKKNATFKAIDTAKAAVLSARARLTGAAADVEDAKAQVQVARANLDRAQVFQDYTTIRAPFDGVVTHRYYHEGDFIREGSSPGNQPILAVARTDLMRVIVMVPDPDVPFTHRNDRAEVRLDNLPEKVFKAKVARTALSEDYNSRTMRTEIDLPNPNNLLTNGMFGSVTIYLGANAAALTVPTACLGAENKQGQRTLYVVRAGKARQVAVRVGRDDGVNAEVLSGLSVGEQVIQGHGPGLADGVAVAVQQPSKD